MTYGYLIYANDATFNYLTGVHASDPALCYVAPDGTVHLPASDLDWPEWSRKSKAKLHAYHAIFDALKAAGTPSKLSHMALWLVQQAPADTVLVPPNFPASLYAALQELGAPIAVKTQDPFIDSMQFFNLEQVAAITQAQRDNEQAFLRAYEILREADIANNNALMWKGVPLTAETLRTEMRVVGVRLGAYEWHTTSPGPVIGCGLQGAIPHEKGYGPLRAHELIVIDNFPLAGNAYWGDLTRTVLKGTPSQWQRDLVHAVTTGQQLAVDLVKDGALGYEIHMEVMRYFDRCGFKTGHADDGTPYGYTHSLGHPVGLDLRGPGANVFKRPSATGEAAPLKAGHVITIEPGLYYPVNVNGGVGGCRVEDIVAVTDTGCRNLTTLTKEWILS